MTQYTRFDLENAITSAYNTIDDLALLYQVHSDRKEPLSEDEMANRLLGLTLLHSDRMDRVFEIYEELVESGVVK